MAFPIRATSLWGYTELVRSLGGDPADFLSQCDIPVDGEFRPDLFIPVTAYCDVLEVTADGLDCPDFGLRLSNVTEFGILGPVAVVVRNSETVLDAFRAAARFTYVHSPILRVVEGHHSATHMQFRYELARPIVPYPLQATEVALGLAASGHRLLIGSTAGTVISFMHDQHGSDASYRDAFGCPVRFAQDFNGFAIPTEVAATRIANADNETRRIATSYLEATYLQPDASLSERVGELVRRLLSTGHCTVDAIAGQLAMHPRTLQRRLAQEGVRCQDLIDRERRIEAARYLALPGLTLGQIAGFLGYTEQSALNRSCRRWFGMTPREYRAEHAAKAAIA